MGRSRRFSALIEGAASGEPRDASGKQGERRRFGVTNHANDHSGGGRFGKENRLRLRDGARIIRWIRHAAVVSIFGS
jgi:hypothetical protein